MLVMARLFNTTALRLKGNDISQIESLEKTQSEVLLKYKMFYLRHNTNPKEVWILVMKFFHRNSIKVCTLNKLTTSNLAKKLLKI